MVITDIHVYTLSYMYILNRVYYVICIMHNYDSLFQLTFSRKGLLQILNRYRFLLPFLSFLPFIVIESLTQYVRPDHTLFYHVTNELRQIFPKKSVIVLKCFKTFPQYQLTVHCHLYNQLFVGNNINPCNNVFIM